MSNHNPQSAYADSPLERGHEGQGNKIKSVPEGCARRRVSEPNRRLRRLLGRR